MDKKKILSVNNLEKYFVKSGKLIKVLEDINFDVYEKDFFGIIGESGSGKSTTGKCIIGLYEPTSGLINFDNKIINHKNLNKKDKKWLCKNMSMIFQDPMSSLNPRKNVLSLVAEPLFINKVITKDVKETIHICQKINAYFKNTFRWQDYHLNSKYLIPFYQSATKVFQEGAKNIMSFDLNEKNIKTLILNFSSFLLDVESSYKILIPQIYKINSLTKDLVRFNLNKLESKKIHIEESNYYELEKELNEKNRLLKAPQDYWDLKQEKEKLAKELQEIIINLNNKSHSNGINYLQATINSLKTELNIYRQNKNITTSLSEYHLLKVKILMIKETLNILKNFDVNNCISIEDLEYFLAYIDFKIKARYNNIILDLIKLLKIGETIDELSLEKDDKKNIYKIISEYRILYEKIVENIKVLSTKNIANEFYEIDILKSKLIKKSNLVQAENIKRKEMIQNNIEKINQRLHKIKTEYVNSSEFLTNKQILDQAKIKLEKEFLIKEDFVKKENANFKNKIIPLIDKQNEEINQCIRSFKESKKNYFNKINIIKKNIIKFIKEGSDDDKKYWINFIKKEISSKIKNIKAIDFELETYLDEIYVYKKIRTTNKYKIKIYNHALKQIITREYVYQALNDVGLKNEHAYRYPHEFSGGQRQRIVIARALIMKPKLIIADEPISALDVSIQAQVINIMKNLSKTLGITFLFIAHDLSMVRYVSNRLIIMHKGRIVEKGETKIIFKNPIHPYTKSLIKSSPELRKIHVNLANLNDNLEYDKEYDKSEDKPKFYSVDENNEHFVFATKEQILKWTK